MSNEPNGGANTDPTKNGDGANGSDPTKSGEGATTTIDLKNFESSKLPDDVFAKIFDDERLWKHDRFKQLSEKARKAKEYEESEAKRQEEEAKKKGEWEKLSKQKEEEASTWRSKYEGTLINNAIMAAAQKAGVQDLDAATKLIDRNAIKVEEDGSVSGVTEAMDLLVKDKSYLLSINRNTAGSATNPTNADGNVRIWKMSEIRDTKIYREHEKEIREAIAKGQVDYNA